ncbi:uncharacterized protein LOC133531335 [Cydia pomonella]|uniref:uncharacterized protein LOC133531335 n=1 Tax=Cydia pomonella TaxID=82600 RepID=UPI002ADDBB49|nr:uncharacterized protein LOC133531335 [Cydia pomonella]
MICQACYDPIDGLEELICVTCKRPYHYKCFNITTAAFMARNYAIRHDFRCLLCTNITSRRKNDNTPARGQLSSTLQDQDHTNMSLDNVSINDETNLNLGDTIGSPQQIQNSQPITLDQISSLLKNNNTFILTDFKKMLHTEITAAIEGLKTEFTNKHTQLTSQQESMMQQINEANSKIDSLQRENQQIKTQLAQVQMRSNPVENPEIIKNQKKFIVYGLDEYYGEKESDLYPRLNNMFCDILNVNINSYIESAQRIGKKGNRRPLLIELISKRMKAYILENSRAFRNTGYAVSDVLDNEALIIRRDLRDQLRRARESGKHAVIRNNRLFINGIECQPTQGIKSHPVAPGPSNIAPAIPTARISHNSIANSPAARTSESSRLDRQEDLPSSTANQTIHTRGNPVEITEQIRNLGEEEKTPCPYVSQPTAHEQTSTPSRSLFTHNASNSNDQRIRSNLADTRATNTTFRT